jgi:hypothetical protein
VFGDDSGPTVTAVTVLTLTLVLVLVVLDSCVGATARPTAAFRARRAFAGFDVCVQSSTATTRLRCRVNVHP